MGRQDGKTVAQCLICGAYWEDQVGNWVLMKEADPEDAHECDN